MRRHCLSIGLAGRRAAGIKGLATNPAGRVAGPDEIASFVPFLLRDEAAFITGAALAVSGGFAAQ